MCGIAGFIGDIKNFPTNLSEHIIGYYKHISYTNPNSFMNLFNSCDFSRKIQPLSVTYTCAVSSMSIRPL